MEEVVEKNLSEASRKGKMPMPHGEGSSKLVDHSDTVSPIEANIGEVFRDFSFWTISEAVKEVVSTHPEEVESQPSHPRREIREILVERIALPIDRGPPLVNSIPERSRTMPLPRTRGNFDASIIPTRDIPVISSSVNRRRYSYGDKVIVENHAFNYISRQSGDLWMGPLTVERSKRNMYFLSTKDGLTLQTPVHQVHLGTMYLA